MDLILRFVGGVLALGSMLFAVSMIRFEGENRRASAINKGLEIGRARRVAADRWVARIGEVGGFDFTPSGSIERRGGDGLLPEFELIDCDGLTARIRTPHGRVLRARVGLRIPGAGEIISMTQRTNGWVVTTREGRIVSR